MRRLILPLLALAAFVLGTCAVHAQTCLFPSRPGDPDILQKFNLASTGKAWAIVGEPPSQFDNKGEGCMASHLFLTEDAGQTWRDITPSSMPTLNIGELFFLDPSYVWMLSTDALDEQPKARFYLLSTEDGGKHWRTLVIERPTFYLMDDYYFPKQLFFVDSQHGWMLWQWHMMNSTHDALLATNDGGVTWKRLPDPPGGGPIQFLSPQDGWIIGGPENWRGVGRPEDTQLWETRDGGAMWKPLPVPIPVDSPQQRLHLIAFKFKNMTEGMLAAGAQAEGVNQTYTNCFTRDGGKTWQFSQFEALEAGPSIGDKHIFWCVGHRDTKNHRLRWATLQKDTDPFSLAMPEGFSDQVRPTGCISFIDDENAWGRLRVEGRTKLMVTTDAGKTSRFMPLPLASIK